MKWLYRSFIIIWLILLIFGVYWAWQEFDNAQEITHGGWLYDDNGEIIGLYDGWGDANYPHWKFIIALPIFLLTKMPYWWMIAYFGIGFYLLIPYLLTNKRGYKNA